MTAPQHLVLGLVLGALLGLAVGQLLGRVLARRDEQLVVASVEALTARAAAGVRQEGEASVERQREVVAQLAGPVREGLGLLEAQLRRLELERTRSSAELRESVRGVQHSSELLGRQTTTLVDALRRPQSRGVWGEVQLRRCVEIAGMVAHCDFTEQVGVAGPDGRLQPDLVVHLAGGRSIVVDAKVSLAAFLEATEATDDAAAGERMATHARHLRRHVDQLAAKSYWQALPDSPEFVVLFLPGESLLAPALEHDPALLEHALAARVHLATPTTLVSLLRTSAHGWQQQELAGHAREVVAAGRQLLDRASTLGAHVDKLGRSLDGAVHAYNKAVGSLEASLLPAARRLSQLGVLHTSPLPDLAALEVQARVPRAPELVPAEDDAERYPRAVSGTS